MTSIILAGGENRRLPFVKSMMIVDGSSILDRILRVHRGIFEKIVISTNTPECYFRFGHGMVGDVITERGPMTGIFSVMMNHHDERFFVTACDMPFPCEELIRYIISIDTDADAVIPLYEGDPQPLLGMYTRKIMGRLYENIVNKRKGLRRFLGEIDTHFIDEEDIKKIDPEGRSFININTIDDLKKIEGGNICSDLGSKNL